MPYYSLNQVLMDPQIGGWAGMLIYAIIGVGLGTVIGRMVASKTEGGDAAMTSIGGMIGLLCGIAMNVVFPLQTALRQFSLWASIVMAVFVGGILFKGFSWLFNNKIWALILSSYMALFGFRAFHDITQYELGPIQGIMEILTSGPMFTIAIFLIILAFVLQLGQNWRDPSGNWFQKSANWWHDATQPKAPPSGPAPSGGPPSGPAPTGPAPAPVKAPGGAPGTAKKSLSDALSDLKKIKPKKVKAP